MVDGNDSLGGGRHRHLAIAANVEEVHAIVVVTHAVRPVVGLGAGIAVSGDAGFQGVASGMQHFHGVTGRHHHLVKQALADWREAQQIGRRQRGQTGRRGATWQHRKAHERGQADAATQNGATVHAIEAFFQNILKVGVVRKIVDGIMTV